MNDINDRTRLIQNRLDELFLGSAHAAVSAPDKESWESYPLPSQYRYGWLPPVKYDEPLAPDALSPVADLMVSYCPEIIAEQTVWLDDDGLDIYLSITETIILRHMTLMADEPDMSEEERTRRVEEEIIDALASTDHLSFYSEVQMRILDETQGW